MKDMNEIKENVELLKRLQIIYDKYDDGICSSCDYGVLNCITDGKAKCAKEVNEDVQKESV